jgi:hypothetical protein
MVCALYYSDKAEGTQHDIDASHPVSATNGQKTVSLKMLICD